MIDKNGNKIVPASKNTDAEYVLKRIAFLLKGFKNNRDDLSALRIAKVINEYSKAGGDFETIKDFQTELENYAKKSKSETFVWELVYIRRYYANQLKEQKNYVSAFEHCYISAQLFDVICTLTPTFHNKRVAAYEYSVAGLFLLDRNLITLKEIISKAEEYFSSLPITEKIAYYETGRLFYYVKLYYLEHTDKDREEIINCLKKLTYFLREGYRLDRTELFYLREIVTFYTKGFEYIKFITSDEVENLENVLIWIKEAENQGIGGTNYLWIKINSLMNKFKKRLEES